MLSTNYSLQTPSSRLGVGVAGTGFVKGGAPFAGIGLNHWGAFINEISPLGIPSNYRADLPVIRSTYGIPFIRVSLGFFSRETWYTGWYLNQTAYIAKLDEFISYCESVGIGCIVSLLWNARAFTDMCYDVYGSHSAPKDLAYKHTKAHGLFSQFVTQVVDRYKNSPAIYGWELGNELNYNVGHEYAYSWKLDGTDAVGGAWANWGNSPTGSPYKITDKFTPSEWLAFSNSFVSLVNSLDPHRRMISSGAGLGLQFAVGAQLFNTSNADTVVQWSGVPSTEGRPYPVYRDKPFNTVCSHIYPQSSANTRFFVDGQKTAAELIQLHKQWADAAGKPLFLGEFGSCYLDPADESSTDTATEAANFLSIMTAIATNGVQMASAWNYAGDLSGAYSWMKWKLSDPSRIYQLEAIALANIEIQ